MHEYIQCGRNKTKFGDIERSVLHPNEPENEMKNGEMKKRVKYTYVLCVWE